MLEDNVLLGSYWLMGLIATIVLYIVVTAPCWVIKRSGVLGVVGFHLLILVALAAPFAALVHPAFWSVLGLSLLLWIALLIYHGNLLNAVRSDAPAVIYMLPLMAWIPSLALAVLIHFIKPFFQ